MRLNSRVELVEFQSWPDRGTGYFKVQVAVSGHRIPGVRDPGVAYWFDVHESDWKQMDERERAAYLERSAISLLGRYGDARDIRVREDGQIVPRFGEDESAV